MAAPEWKPDFGPSTPHPTAGDVRQLGSPMRLSETPTRREKAAPRFGEDSEAVLRELGCGEEEIARLIGDGVVKTPAQEPPKR